MNQDRLNQWKKARKERMELLHSDDLFERIIRGERDALSIGITLVESNRKEDQFFAEQLIKKCLSFSGKALRIGITGVPGVGKSTFLEAFGNHVIQQDKKIAILAIDPTSSQNGGSILGDKTRMETLSNHAHVFIRPTPAGDSLGGVARKTRETIFLCEAAGFDVIFIETVGVGQSETLVHSMVDFFLLLMLSGAGDELQGIKRGIMEMADALVITKADGENENAAKMAAISYQNAMHLFPAKPNNWIPKALIASSFTKKNIDKIWEIIAQFETHNSINGWIKENRKQQDLYWMHETLKALILNQYFGEIAFETSLKQKENEVLNGQSSPFDAAQALFKQFKK